MNCWLFSVWSQFSSKLKEGRRCACLSFSLQLTTLFFLSFFHSTVGFNLRVSLVWLLSSYKQLYNIPKSILQYFNMFGLAFQNCFYPPKAILHEATIPSFWFFKNQFYIIFYILIITTYYFPLFPFINSLSFCFVINLMNEI